jgi:dephospho-CoA kinase
VVDADVVAREVVEIGQPVLKKIHDSFGDWVLSPNGSLNRRALREHIFQNPSARHQLEQITHPAIRQSIVQQLQNATSPYVILVSPLLFETDQHQLTDRTLLIDASEAIQIERASQRDGQDSEQIKKLLQHKCHEQKRKIADDIVINDGHLDHLYQQLENYIRII